MFLTFRIFLLDVKSILSSGEHPLIGMLGKNTGKNRTLLRVVMQSLISLIILAFSIVVMLDHQQGDGTKKLASTALGTILGYWLR